MNIQNAPASFVQKSLTLARGLLPTALLIALTLAPFVHSATDTPPNRMTVQSYITDDTGTPLGDNTPVNKKMVFFVYNADTGGSVVFADEQIVTVDQGHFSVVLGEGIEVTGKNHDLATGFSGADASDRFIEITVSDTNDNNKQTLSPRLRLLPSAYAFLASFANEAATVSGGAIDTAALGDGAVTSAAIADRTITNVDIALGTIDWGELHVDSVRSEAIQAGAVGSDEIEDRSIDYIDIKVGAVGPGELKDGGVTSAAIATGAVGSDEIEDRSITNVDIAPGAINYDELHDSAVISVKIANDAVRAYHIENGAVRSDELSSDLTLRGNIGVNLQESNVTFDLKMNVGDDFPMYLHNSSGGDIFWVDSSGDAYTAGGFITLSDRRYKNNIQPVESLLEGALSLNPVTYSLNAQPDSAEQLGLIAQDVQESFPSVVANIGDEEGHLAISYDRIGVIAIGALKELNEKLEAKNADLEERLAALEAMVQSLAQ